MTDYKDDKQTLMFGDCLERMKEIPDGSVDMILCDLPYGTTACKWDVVISFEKLWEQYSRVIRKGGAIVLTASQPFTSALIMSNIKKFKYCWTWEKERPSNFFQAKFAPLNNTEDVVVFSDGGTNNGAKLPMTYYPQGVKKSSATRLSSTTGGKVGQEHKTAIKKGEFYAQDGEGYPFKTVKFLNDKNTVHPTQKPVALMEYLINTYTVEGQTILDNCMGSGTTGVACKNLNRHFIGIEKDEKYFNVCLERLTKI